jgi:peptidyl-dipeptidase A
LRDKIGDMKKLLLLVAGLPAFAAPPTVQDAKRFLDEAEAKLLVLTTEAGHADWVHENFITFDTETLSATADERAIAEGVRLAKGATRFDHLKLPPDMARKMTLLKLGLTLAAPSDPKESAEVTQLAAKLDGVYGKGKYCPDDKKPCLDVEGVTRILANSTDARELLEAWTGWHTISLPMRRDFVRFVELSNKGARELGFKDTGAMWRAKYDMPPDDFAKELDRLWEQVRPLYVSLHAYVRWKLHEKYGDVVPPNGPIPAHLLGNIWAQEWNNV